MATEKKAKVESHPHAESMRLYAEDAAETDKPWERWEVRIKGSTGTWGPIHFSPTWDDTYYEYRRKPSMLLLNGYEYPEPERMALAEGTRYWVPNIRTLNKLTTLDLWGGSVFDFFQLRRGLVHLSEENAEAHARAIILAGGGEV